MAMTRDEFEVVYRSQATRVARLAGLLTGSQERVDDLVSEVFSRCWRRWRVAGMPSDVTAYLRQALLNEVAREWRTRRRWSRQAEAPNSFIDESASTVERLRVVAALQLLAPQQRAVVVLRYYEDLSLAQTAEALGIPLGTVKSTSARALERLAALLSEEPSEALE